MKSDKNLFFTDNDFFKPGAIQAFDLTLIWVGLIGFPFEVEGI